MDIERVAAYTSGTAEPCSRLSLRDYSMFKYGYKPAALRIAKAMTETLLAHIPHTEIAKNRDGIIVTTSPYWYAQPAAHALATYVTTALNELLLADGVHPLKFVRIHRSNAPSCDFSSLSKEEREANMAQNVLSADAEAFRGMTVIVIEDARITGAHEKKLIDFFEQIGARRVIFLYAAMVGEGCSDPQVEHRMNHDIVADLDALYALMRHPELYVLNSRACRFILERGGTAEFPKFLARLSDAMLRDIYRYGVNDGYGLTEKYRAGVQGLAGEIARRAKPKERRGERTTSHA